MSDQQLSMSIIQAQIVKLERLTGEVNLIRLALPDGPEGLPSATAGSHIAVHIPGIGTRHYSILNPGVGEGGYDIAVKREENGRGGSRWMHDVLRIGQVLEIEAPRNNFPLEEDASHSVLIAGGIGITPLLAMKRRLEELGRSFALHYAARSPEHCLFRAQLADQPNVRLHVDTQAGGPLPVERILREAPSNAHVYCCGPAPLLEAFLAGCSANGIGKERAHLERFTAGPAEHGQSDSFVVELARSGGRYAIPPNRSILDVLLEAGIQVPFSCEEGICGTCATPVREGIPDHRDWVLREDEKRANDVMMLCCSRSLSDCLVLDI